MNSLDKLITDKEVAIKKLSKIIDSFIEEHSDFDKAGIYFSGGVDASLITFLIKNYNKNFICYVIGTKDSHDVKLAKKAAKLLKLKLKDIILTEQSVINATKKIKKLTSSKLLIEILTPIDILSKEMKKDGMKIAFSGVGAEDIFAGYRIHMEKVPHWKEVRTAELDRLKSSKDFDWFNRIAKLNKIKLYSPFIDKQLIEYAMKIHPKLKVSTTDRKIILREAAEYLGLPKELSWTPKKAIQYGSGIHKIFKTLRY